MAENIQQTESTLIGGWLAGDNGRMSKSQRRLLMGAVIAVCLAVAVVHWPALSAKAISFDDDRYYLENPLVRNPSINSAWRFLSEVLEPSTVEGYYQPLTMISLMVDYAMSVPGEELRSFHTTSLALHVANTALIIVLLYFLFGRIWVAAAVGLLFGVHPLTVEPIPWVGERKTLLAAFFALWALVFYVRFVRKGGRKWYIWTMVMYVLALMSKPTSTPLPMVMLLLDYWPLRRLRIASVLEKIPFFVVGGISGIITYVSQARTASVITPHQYGAMRAPLVICHNIIFYPFKMLWPVKLTSHYPFPEPLGISNPMILIGVIGTVVLLVALVISLRWTRAAVTGWLIFFIMALPTMQALQFSDVIASDKFVYLPSIGVLIMLAAFLCWLCRRQIQEGVLTKRCVIMVVIILALAGSEAVATRKYLVCWRDSLSLWRHMVEVTPYAPSPRNNFGIALVEAGDVNAAMEQFQTILVKKPGHNDALYNMGNIMAGKGNAAEAREYYEKAIKQDPKRAEPYYGIGLMLVNEGKLEEALDVYRKGLKAGAEPVYVLKEAIGAVLVQMGRMDEAMSQLGVAVQMRAYSAAYGNMGLILASKGLHEKAMEYYQKAVRLDPSNSEAHYNLGNAYLGQGKLKLAIGEYRQAIQLKRSYVKAYGNLAIALASSGQLEEAIGGFRRVVEFEPNSPDAYFNLAGALVDSGAIDEAIENLRKVIELSPRDPVAHSRLAEALLRKGKVEQAIAEYEAALKIAPDDKDAKTGLEKAKAMQKDGAAPKPAGGPKPANP